MADTPSYPGMPRWVKVLGIVVLALAVLVIIHKATGIGGEHGPGRPIRGSGHASPAPGVRQP